MTKGQKRRREILTCAERLFYTKGYDATTIQDILDELKLSKGGFYHHFVSKEQLLEEICEAKTQKSYNATLKAVQSCTGSSIEKLNAMYDKNGIWQDEDLDYIGLLIRVSYKGDNLRMRQKMKEMNFALALPLFNNIVQEGVENGVFYTPYPDGCGELLLHLGSNLTDEIASILVTSQGDSQDLAKILSKLELYRYAVETLIGAPFGSIIMFQMGRMAEVCDSIWKDFKNAEKNYNS